MNRVFNGVVLQRLSSSLAGMPESSIWPRRSPSERLSWKGRVEDEPFGFTSEFTILLGGFGLRLAGKRREALQRL
jgi:hypothetical protein